MGKVYSLNNLKTRESKLSRNARRIIFYSLILLLPLIQFCIFYIYVNFNSISMAFSVFEDTGEGFKQIFGFSHFVDNMKNVFTLFKERPEIITNSLFLFLFDTGLGLPLALIFSFYIYKKKPLSKIFRVTLFMPQIISGVIFASIYSYLFGAIATVFDNPSLNLLSEAATVDQNRFAMIAFSLAMTFGVNVLLFSGSMGNINPSLVEAAELDGCTLIGELIHVTLPSIFPTIISFIIVGISGIFTNQMFLVHIKMPSNQLDTLGYFMYSQAAASDYISDKDGLLSYPELSCISILITLILFPLTLAIKKLLEKFGPSTK